MNHSNHQDNFRMIALPHIFSTEKGRIDVLRPAGGNVSDIIRSIGWTPDSLSARVFIDGEYVKDAAWEYTVPRAGQSMIVRAVPMGGDEGGKDVGRIVAMVAILALAIATQQYWAVGLAWGIGVTVDTAFAIGIATTSIVTSLAISGLIPAPLPRRALPQPIHEPRLQEAA